MKLRLSSHLFVLACACISLASAQSNYRIIDLGTLGGTTSLSISLDEYSRVVGRSANGSGDDRGFMWSGSSQLDIGALPGEATSEARDINNAGDICGSSGDSAVLWLPAARYGLNAGLNDIGNLGGSFIAPGHHGINDKAEVCGQGSTAGGTLVPFLWLPAAAYGLPAGMNQLPGLSGPSTARASALRDDGVVTGYSTLGAGGTIRWVVWMPGMPPQDLGVFGEGLGLSEGSELVIAGYTLTPTNIWHATRWSQAGGFVDIHDSTAFPPGFDWSFSYDINSAGTMVGFATTDATFATRRAYVWDAVNGMRDLNDLVPPGSGWVLNDVRRINEAGQISGFGTFNGQTRAFLLNPDRLEFLATPSPASSGMQLRLNATGGDPGESFFMGMIEVNGQPLNPPQCLFHVLLDGTGAWSGIVDLPPALMGFDVTLLGVSFEAGTGALVYSDPFHVVIQ